jgi:DNA-binding transcriptional LysR family regulator
VAADVQHRRVLRVGLQTSIGRDLYPAASRRFAELANGWRLSTRLQDWADPSAGLLAGHTDAAFLWLPAPVGIGCHVLRVEPRWVALPSTHRLAAYEEIPFEELLDEPFIAMPPEAGELREFWLATAERRGRPVAIGAVATSSDETFEAIASGLGVHLLAEGNAVIYARPGITCRPVRGLAPCRLAVAWRHEDRRPEVRAFVNACLEAARSAGSAQPDSTE